MKVDRKWVERNLGFDPIKTPAPDSTFTLREAARSRSVEDLQREIIDFDSEAPGRTGVPGVYHRHGTLTFHRGAVALQAKAGN